MDANTLEYIKGLSIEEKMELYEAIADEIIEFAYQEDGIRHNLFKAKLVRVSDLYANDYNPNKMPDTEMELLIECIRKYGFLFAVITSFDKEKGKYRIIDGYHRYEDFKRNNWKWIAVLDLNLFYHDAVQLTVLMNRIKGLHQVEGMSDIIVKLENLGVEDSEICKNLGMEAEEYLRLKQQLGIAHAFRNHQYSNSWEIDKK